MKRFLILLTLSAFSLISHAYDVEVDGIYYNLKRESKEASVTRSYNYSGSIIIPESFTLDGVEYKVTSIGDEAFMWCYLTSVIIPNSVTSIGNEAFEGCYSLTSIDIPNSVTSIGDGAFYGCASLTSIDIPNSVTSIGDGAFYGCASLTSVTIGNSVTSIGDRAFYDCAGLTSIYIPNSVTSIGGGVFGYCYNLTSLVVAEDNPTYAILDNVLFDKEIKTLVCCPGSRRGTYTIPNSVSTIVDRAFYNCADLTSVYIPNSVTSIGNEVFYGCGLLTSLVVANDNPTYASLDNVLFDKEIKTLVCCPLSRRGKYTIPNSVTSIGDAAFYGCYWLTSIDIPNSVTSIGNRAFDDCSCLTSVTIGNSVTSIGDMAFANCSNLTSVIIPNSVTTIGDNAFWECGSLTSVIIGNSVTNIGEGAFGLCYSLTSIIIGNSVTSIGEAAFMQCFSLTSITIPNSVTSIGKLAFYNCGLTSIDIPNSVISIGDGAFVGCHSLTSLVVAEDNPTYASLDNVLFDKEIKTLICCPRGKAGEYTIPNSVTSIGNDAFYQCDYLTSVTIGNSVTSIGEEAFDMCENLAELKCYAVNPPTLGGWVFKYTQQSTGTLYVPAESVDAYNAAEQWRDWGTILPLTDNPTGIDGSRMADRGKASVFMLDGRKANSGIKKGIYIVNGKKLATKD